MTRIGIGFMWLLHWLPLPVLAACGRLLGLLLLFLGRSRRHVVMTNLGLCFPAMSAAEKSALARRHFMLLGRSFLERGMLWWASANRIRRLVRVDGLESLTAHEGPLILLIPHFVGLDAAWTRLSMERNMAGMYAKQNNPVFDAFVLKGRYRFGNHIPVTRQDGPRRGIKAIKSGFPFFYPPDMDFGPSDAIFVPFFGVPAATITGLPRMARMTGAAVLPVIARMTDTGDCRYVIKVGPALADYPGADLEVDTRRMNAFIEAEVLKMPEQYYWVHRRFKTRPPGENRVY